MWEHAVHFSRNLDSITSGADAQARKEEAGAAGLPQTYQREKLAFKGWHQGQQKDQRSSEFGWLPRTAGAREGLTAGWKGGWLRRVGGVHTWTQGDLRRYALPSDGWSEPVGGADRLVPSLDETLPSLGQRRGESAPSSPLYQGPFYLGLENWGDLCTVTHQVTPSPACSLLTLDTFHVLRNI